MTSRIEFSSQQITNSSSLTSSINASGKRRFKEKSTNSLIITSRKRRNFKMILMKSLANESLLSSIILMIISNDIRLS
jgi:hypothetical protein